MAVRSAADALLDFVSLVNSYDSIFAFKLGFILNFGLYRPHDVWVCPLAQVLLLLLQLVALSLWRSALAFLLALRHRSMLGLLYVL